MSDDTLLGTGPGAAPGATSAPDLPRLSSSVVLRLEEEGPRPLPAERSVPDLAIPLVIPPALSPVMQPKAQAEATEPRLAPPDATAAELRQQLNRRNEELASLAHEYESYRAWVERVQHTLAVLSTSSQADTALHRLVESLVTESSYEFAAVLSSTRQTAYGPALPACDQARLIELAHTARDRNQLVIASLGDEQEPGALLRWYMCGPITSGSNVARSVDNDLVLMVARTARTLPLFPPPWEREAQQFKHILFTLSHALAAVRYRAAVVAERNSLREKVAEATAQLSAALAQAEEARQVAEDANRQKSAFLAIASHELRTPLNAIIGYAELLHDSLRGQGLYDLVSDAQQIREAAKHLVGLIGNILDMSKIEAGKMDLFLEEFELLELLTTVVRGMRPNLTKNNNRLHMSAEGGPFQLYADLIKVRQVLSNILSNAAKFTRDGEIFVEVRRTTSRPETIEIVIRDTGIGMSPAQMQRLFRPFSQVDISTHRNYGGTGLGLAIAQRFCQMMGGEITVESHLGQGSQFITRLPERCRPTERRSGTHRTLRV